MAIHLGWIFSGMLLLVSSFASAKLVMPNYIMDLNVPFATNSFNRKSFPSDFIFGTASSSYQVARSIESSLSF
jgi:beta-glucosidase